MIMNQKTISIDNLKCSGCANSIKSKLSGVKGLLSTEVNVDEGQVMIGYSGEEVVQRVKQLLSEMGYPERGTSTLLQKGKSYISCAIGRLKSDTE